MLKWTSESIACTSAQDREKRAVTFEVLTRAFKYQMLQISKLHVHAF